MPRLIFAILLTPFFLNIAYLVPPYETFTLWWFRLELVFSYVAMFLFGLPLIWIFVRKGWTRCWQAILGGISTATLFLILWFLMTNWEHFVLNGLPLSIYGWTLGAIGGLVFWVIAFWRNPRYTGPNNSSKPTPQNVAA